MKKVITVLMTLLCLSACDFEFDFLGEKKSETNDRYIALVESICEHTIFESSSNYYDISGEIAPIEDGYRFYVTIDNPHNALYDIEAMAIMEGVDYSSTMAASVGIFEDDEYCLIPNQTNPSSGYYEGLVMSGTCSEPEVTLYIYVSFKNEDHSSTRSEYIKLYLQYEGE